MPPAGDEHSKPRPPVPNSKRKKERENLKYNKTLLAAQHQLTTPLHTSRYSARFAQSRGRSISVSP